MFNFEISGDLDKNLVIFTGQLEGDDGEYGDEIDTIFKERNTSYNEIVFLCPNYLESSILSFIADGDRLISNLGRADEFQKISFVSFDGFSDLKLFHKVGGEFESIADSPVELKKNIIQSGVYSLVEKRKNQVILKAPPGTVFQKPSKKKFSEFIKSSELTVGFSENQFVAFSLLASRPRREGGHATKNIWIDTGSISLFVEPLIYYMNKFNGDAHKTIKYHSFQSYGDEEGAGYKTCVPDVLDDVWVIISASRSNSMGCDIFNVWKGLDHEQIVTLLSYSDTKYDQEYLSKTKGDNEEYPAQPGDGVVVNISKFSENHQNEISFGSEVPIKIIGENFTVQVEDPNQVLLRKVHGPIEISSFIDPINQSNSILCNKKNTSRLRSIYFDFVRFRADQTKLNSEYERWLKDVVTWYMPSSIGYVIYDFNDDASVTFFNDIKPHLVDFLFQEVDINDVTEIKKDKGVVALMPVITKGHSFIKLNSDLRLLGHDGQRFFIAPFATPQTKRDFELFQRSLILGPRNLKYNFLNFKKVYVGHQEAENSWQRELQLIERFSSDVWVRRAEKLRKQSDGLQNAIGASCNPNTERLDFNVDFAFWKPGYVAENVNASAVYWTISSILQNLREKQYTDFDKETLFNHVYQHSVLDPSNFSRFNDPLLQSCLWRSAYDGELDFRIPADLSRKFADILKRLALSRATGEFNATLDLLLAIAIGKVKISEEYLERIVDELSVLLVGESAYTEILQYIGFEFLHREMPKEALRDIM